MAAGAEKAEETKSIVSVDEDALVAKVEAELQELQQLRKTEKKRLRLHWSPAEVESLLINIGKSRSIAKARDAVQTEVLRKQCVEALERASGGNYIRMSGAIDVTRKPPVPQTPLFRAAQYCTDRPRRFERLFGVLGLICAAGA